MQDPSELRDWQAHPSYTHEREVGALRQVVDDADDVLLFGDYGAVLATLLSNDYDTCDVLTKSHESGVEDADQHYHVSSYHGLPSLPSYDAIIAAWVDWPKRPQHLIKDLASSLNDAGSLIVETADESSEYTTVLETLQPRIKGSIYDERLSLLEPMTTAFTVSRYQVRTAYHFQSIDDFILYFNQHAHHEWGRKTRQDEKQRLRKIGDRLGYETVKERGILLKGST